MTPRAIEHCSAVFRCTPLPACHSRRCYRLEPTVKKYCYVIVCARHGSETSIESFPFRTQNDPWVAEDANLPQLLQRGWQPVREVPLGGVGDGRSAFALVLLEGTETR